MAKDNDLKKLPPEERIRRLKELEKERKKEIEEAQKEIQESEKELTERRKWKEKVPIPEFAKEDLEGLSEEARQLLKERKGLAVHQRKEMETEEEAPLQRRASLEEAIEQERVQLPADAAQVEYGMQQARFGEVYKPFQEMPMKELQQQVYQLGKAAGDRGYATREEVKLAHYAVSEVEKRLEAAEEGTYSLTEEAARAATLTQELSSTIQNLYKRQRQDHQQYRL